MMLFSTFTGIKPHQKPITEVEKKIYGLVPPGGRVPPVMFLSLFFGVVMRPCESRLFTESVVYAHENQNM